jgi:hypothetical protein
MCLRLRILKRPINSFFASVKPWLVPSPEEWSHVEYLIKLTGAFNACTQAIGRSRTTSIWEVYDIYNALLDHIERQANSLRKKKKAWKKGLADGLDLAFQKLSKYYTLTSSPAYKDLDQLYAFSWLLHPKHRNTAFSSASWKAGRGGQSYQKRYKKAFEAEWKLKYASLRTPDIQVKSTVVPARLVDIIRTIDHPSISDATEFAELEDYFNTGTFPIFILIYYLTNTIIGKAESDDPLEAWREHENYKRFPTIAKMARDYLCSPATSVGVERQFYLARCQAEFNRPYSRDTFEALMLVKDSIRQERRIALDAPLDQDEEDSDYGDNGGLSGKELLEEFDTRRVHLAHIMMGGDKDHPIILISDDEDSDSDSGTGSLEDDDGECKNNDDAARVSYEAIITSSSTKRDRAGTIVIQPRPKRTR